MAMWTSERLDIKVKKRVGKKVFTQSGTIENGQIKTDKKIATEPLRESEDSASDSIKPKEKYPFDSVIEGAYKITENIPFGGKYAKRIIDTIKLKEMAQEFTKITLNPLFSFFKKRR